MKNEKLKPYVVASFLAYTLWVIIFCCLNENEKSVPLCVGNMLFGLVLFGLILYKRKEFVECRYLARLAVVSAFLHIIELTFALSFMAGDNLNNFGALHTGIKVLFIVSYIQTMVILCYFFNDPSDKEFNNDFMRFG